MGNERLRNAPEDFLHMDVPPRPFVRRAVMLWAGVFCGLGFLLALGNVQAQQASVSGFVTDVTDGQPLEQDGGARVTAGQQTIRAADIEYVPEQDVTGDLAT